MTASVDTLLEQFTGVRTVPAPPPAQERPLVLPALAARDLDAVNAFYRLRAPVAFSLGARAATLASAWPPAAYQGAARCLVELDVDGAPAAVIVSPAAIAAVIADLDQYQRIEDMDGGHLALLVELALTPALAALETALGVRIAVTAIGGAAGGLDTAALFFTLAVDGLPPSPGELRLTPLHARRLSALLDHAAGAAAPTLGVTVPACIRIGAATCPIGEVATLAPGDVVLADHPAAPHQAVVVVGEHLAAPLRLTGQGAELVAPLAHVQGSSWEWSMENGADRPQADEKTDFNDIPLKLLFELGRVELALGELRGLAPGAVIALPRGSDDSVDISANGRRIGRGTLVRIGDSLGVRITRLFHHG